MSQDAGRFCEGYAPEAIFISAPLENGRTFADDSDVIVIVDHGTFVAFMENGNISVVGKGPNAEERVGG